MPAQESANSPMPTGHMADFQGDQPSIYHQTEDAVHWSPTDASFESAFFDVNAITRFAMSNDSPLLWNNTSSSPSSSMSQSISNPDPMDRLSDIMPGSDAQAATNCPSFGMQQYHASQWQMQEREPSWQSLDQCLGAHSQIHEAALQNSPLFLHHDADPTFDRQHNVTLSTCDSDGIGRLPVGIPLPDVFISTHAPHQDPPAPTASTPPGAHPQRKSKRCSDDLYTPRWVRNAGPSREGWCGWCAAWFTLRDSAYWYHMHYSHGVSQANSGRRLPAPAGFRAFGVTRPVEWEVKCGKCARWMSLPPGDKWNTAYFRHTYKCYFKTVGSTSARGDRSGPSSPSKHVASPSRRRLDML